MNKRLADHSQWLRRKIRACVGSVVCMFFLGPDGLVLAAEPRVSGQEAWARVANAQVVKARRYIWAHLTEELAGTSAVPVSEVPPIIYQLINQGLARTFAGRAEHFEYGLNRISDREWLLTIEGASYLPRHSRRTGASFLYLTSYQMYVALEGSSSGIQVEVHPSPDWTTGNLLVEGRGRLVIGRGTDYGMAEGLLLELLALLVAADPIFHQVAKPPLLEFMSPAMLDRASLSIRASEEPRTPETPQQEDFPARVWDDIKSAIWSAAPRHREWARTVMLENTEWPANFVADLQSEVNDVVQRWINQEFVSRRERDMSLFALSDLLKTLVIRRGRSRRSLDRNWISSFESGLEYGVDRAWPIWEDAGEAELRRLMLTYLLGHPQWSPSPVARKLLQIILQPHAARDWRPQALPGRFSDWREGAFVSHAGWLLAFAEGLRLRSQAKGGRLDPGPYVLRSQLEESLLRDFSKQTNEEWQGKLQAALEQLRGDANSSQRRERPAEPAERCRNVFE